MSHPRSNLRAVVRAALAAAPDLSGVTVYQSWSHALDSSDPRGIGVYTPSEDVREETGNSTNRETALMVLYRSDGREDLDDHLDDISAVIEPLVISALAEFSLFGLRKVETQINGEGESLQGLLTLTFYAERIVPEGGDPV